MRRSLVLSISALCAAGLAAVPGFSQSERSHGRSLGPPEHVRPAPRVSGRPIPGRFIITLAPRVDPRAVAAEAGVDPEFIYDTVLNGFAGQMSDFAHAKLRADNRVLRIEQDREAVITQAANSWGLDRVDQLALPLDGAYRATTSGRGVTVYVVDSGIRFDHLLFGGRAVRGIDVVNDGYNGSDCNGHGTHVAGTIGGGYGYGMAPGTTLVSARVLNCSGSGSMSGIIYALDWIAANARRPAVVNMSLGGAAVASLDDAVTRLVSSGIATVVAAGNEAADACSSSPARAPRALTVAASDQRDARASFSNYGSCVDLFAPGTAIISGYHTASNALAQMDGTSMAAPHVAGRAALLLEANPALTEPALSDAILSSSNSLTILDALGSPQRLLYLGAVTTTTPVVEPAPAPAPSPVTTPAPISLSATSRYQWSGMKVTLTWSGATTQYVDIFRNGVRITRVSNSGAWSQQVNRGSYVYRICEYKTSPRCSGDASVSG